MEPAVLMTGLLHGPARSLNARVARLLAWRERPKTRPGRAWWQGTMASLVVLAGFAVVYSHLLLHIHTATEWLVR
jgi:hypothetical protein